MTMMSSRRVALVISGLISATEMLQPAAHDPIRPTEHHSVRGTLRPTEHDPIRPTEQHSVRGTLRPAVQLAVTAAEQHPVRGTLRPAVQLAVTAAEQHPIQGTLRPAVQHPERNALLYPESDADPSGGNFPLLPRLVAGCLSADPSNYMSTTLAKCCSSYFSWNYDVCIGNLPGICARSLFYPDWEGSNTGCVDDGNEPSYMTANAVGYMFTHKSDCCQQHYNWNYEECLGISTTANSNLYYPDWEQDHICKKGGGQPQGQQCLARRPGPPTGTLTGKAPKTSARMSEIFAEEALSLLFVQCAHGHLFCPYSGQQPAYMNTNPSQWMDTTQLSCCNKYYSWNSANCLAYGSSSSSTSAGTGKFYMNWVTSKCVQDCVGAAPCGGIAEFWDDLFDTRATCCATK
ncbi:hypothetical protein THAOC_04881 [Thalassiosira oceanica]|uniref:Uncharacterized protein n=1 Tax=Thalassiosira oceanica TaxID=159749 RepID=K0TNF7_THAOC|nr:hypothetical protein THAOC_04881 [Thalassiosira oceanica]|eukprot:EJK73487.1 hypothetical protein THAOC_04881 [Thalassiosira oceanica]